MVSLCFEGRISGQLERLNRLDAKPWRVTNTGSGVREG